MVFIARSRTDARTRFYLCAHAYTTHINCTVLSTDAAAATESNGHELVACVARCCCAQALCCVLLAHSGGLALRSAPSRDPRMRESLAGARMRMFLMFQLLRAAQTLGRRVCQQSQSHILRIMLTRCAAVHVQIMPLDCAQVQHRSTTAK